MSAPLDLEALERAAKDLRRLVAKKTSYVVLNGDECEVVETWDSGIANAIVAFPALLAEVRRLQEREEVLVEALGRLRPLADAGVACDAHDHDAMLQIIDAALGGGQ